MAQELLTKGEHMYVTCTDRWGTEAVDYEFLEEMAAAVAEVFECAAPDLFDGGDGLIYERLPDGSIEAVAYHEGGGAP